ncbi:MAG: leucyl aminopeptidase [Rubricoccaceae bacterium]|nr:leucyl aminopeptidase [Rubricoccaceae bacterium]
MSPDFTAPIALDSADDLWAEALDLLVLPFAERLPEAWRSRLGPAAEQAAADAVQAKAPATLYTEAGRVALVPVTGETDEDRRTAAAKGAAEAARLKAEAVGLAVPEDGDVAPCVEGFLLGAYRFTRYRTEEDAAWPGTRRLVVEGPASDAVERARIRAEATNLARDLVNRSPHETTAQGLGALAKAAGEAAGVRVEVWDPARIEAEGMGGLLAVNRGSQDPPAFIVMEWAPEGHADDAPVVLVGKAVTFDTGGLSLKPTKGSMDTMKADMAGGAAVIGAIVAAARLKLPVRVVALVPSTDNRPGENAYVPGDVVAMHSGATVEVLNTDAEGRMLLADALSYARRYAPSLVVDVATLTGAAVVALGSRVAAVVTRDDADAEARLAPFRRAGEATGDTVWPLPLFGHYKEQLKSDVADLSNVGGREGGTITAAAFLEHFTREGGEPAYPWVHLDIAGPAFLDSAYGYRPKGGTGFGVRLLAAVLAEMAG